MTSVRCRRRLRFWTRLGRRTVTSTELEIGPRRAWITSLCERPAVATPSTATSRSSEPDTRKVGGPTRRYLGDPELLTIRVDGYSNAAEAVAGSPLIARSVWRGIARKAIERAGNSVEHGLVDPVFGKRSDDRRRGFRIGLDPAHQSSPGARLVIGWDRVGGNLSAFVAQHHQRLVTRPETFRHGQLTVEPGEASGTGESKFSARYRRNVEVGDLVETAREQPPRWILRQRLGPGTGGKTNDEGKTARSREHNGWTRRQRHPLQNINLEFPRRSQPGDPPVLQAVSPGSNRTLERPGAAINGGGVDRERVSAAAPDVRYHSGRWSTCPAHSLPTANRRGRRSDRSRRPEPKRRHRSGRPDPIAARSIAGSSRHSRSSRQVVWRSG